jgi:multiple sugar transport system substrate-binding protein
MRPKKLAQVLGGLLLVSVVAACSGSSSGSTSATGSAGAAAASGPVTLTFWSWVPNIDKVVATWNQANPNIQVQVSKPAQGDALVTKILAANKAGNPPDLMQAEYQALPGLVTNGVAADLSSGVDSAKGEFSDSAWNQVTFGGKRYAVPQDIGPMMFWYREDLFKANGLTVPKTWEEYAAQARALHQKKPNLYLGGFSAKDPGWYSGLAAQAGARWWNYDGTNWQVGVNDAASKKVADYWAGLVNQGVIDSSAWWTPEWNAKLNKGTVLSWVSAVWAPGVLSGSAPTTKGSWAVAPLPQWSAGSNVTGFWGGSSTAVAAKSKHQAEATKFALWLNTDAAAIQGLITQGAIYPASTAGQQSPALAKAPDILATDQADFSARAKEIAGTAHGFTWGPNVNVAYNAYNDAFGKAVQSKSAFSGALDAIQGVTVADMKKAGFTVNGS